ncbi:hypothetical protein RND71_040228 [Anisodus tanguticus]|uniref:Neprosin PEP catalytic domain-containing protein n=1 Tax=Anisodus tanguticus TaxID=243964 RepID=A0AAE1R0M1_9SOLA|nr:hypothetical protein RND71_040228 [Anisodus tanguticus]
MVTHLRIIEQFLLLLFLCLSYDEVRGTKLSEQEDLELEKQLKLLNKPPRKTIQLAIVTTEDNTNNKFGGASMIAAIYNPLSINHKLSVNVVEPPMGSGLYPRVRSAKVHAYCKDIALLNDKGENINLLGYKLPTFSTSPMLYNVIDLPDYGEDFNHTIFYGGPDLKKWNNLSTLVK